MTGAGYDDAAQSLQLPELDMEAFAKHLVMGRDQGQAVAVRAWTEAIRGS